MKNKSIIVFIAVSIMLILSSCKSSKKEIINWQSPCDFYSYNKTDKTLELLERFEGVDVIGLSLPKD